MRAGFSFSYPPISLLLGQPLSIKKSYAGAIHPLVQPAGTLPLLCSHLAAVQGL
jgi:hypothetical protein